MAQGSQRNDSILGDPASSTTLHGGFEAGKQVSGLVGEM